jgi:DNA-directed RNA polymerase subunit RPC12/RpoP
MKKKQHLFRNFYKCYRCHKEWEDVWSATYDDDCPHCGARHCSPYKSEDEDDEITHSPPGLFSYSAANAVAQLKS